MKFNKQQQKLYELGKTNNKLIILKARQLGVSTYKAIEGLDRALFYKNQNVVIIAHDARTAKEIFTKVKYAYNNIPEQIRLRDGRIRNKPLNTYDNMSEIVFGDMNSKISVAMHTTGSTPTFVHITELAFRKQPVELMRSVLPSLPQGAKLTIESTANGINNYFYDMRTKNHLKSNSDFTTVFFPRYDDPNYSIELEDADVTIPSYVTLPDHITEPQKNWYYIQAENLKEKVLQEYPSTRRDAFISTSGGVFTPQQIQELETPPIIETVTVQTGLGTGSLAIYREPPTSPNIYLARGVDTCVGEPGGDNASIQIRDNEYRLYASFYGVCKPDNLAKIIDILYDAHKYYAPGRVGIEVNNSGLAVITEAKKYRRHGHIYTRDTYDQKNNKKTKKVGRHTNGATKPLMLSTYEKHINNGFYTEVSQEEKTELYSLVYNDTGSAEASKGNHDDAVISGMISCIMITK